MKSPVWVVKEVQPKEDYTLHLTFADGAKRYIMLVHFWKKLFILPLKILRSFCVRKLNVVQLSGMTM